MEVCSTMVECCSEEKKYCYYYAILARHLCMTDEVYKEYFERCFVQQYSMSDRLEGKKLRNVVTFFAHLLATDTLSLRVLSNIRLTEEETTPASLIFIKLLFQGLASAFGIRSLNERLKDPTLQDLFGSTVFPRDNSKNARFAMNFYSCIGLFGITENLRRHLCNAEPRVRVR